MLVWSNYVAARLFRLAEHRENTLRRPFALFVDRFGAAVIPKELRTSVPRLVRAAGTGNGAPEAKT
jgi:hypothetical protein